MIVIAPWAKPLRNGGNNPKNYPWWPELINLLDSDEQIIQVGTEGETQLVKDFRKNLTLSELGQLIEECRTWIAVDSFFQHLAWAQMKTGVVLWGQSDPLIFGHPENTNLLRDRRGLRPNQFLTWEQAEYHKEVFVDPATVVKKVRLNRQAFSAA